MDHDSIAETPVKRRKTENGFVPSQGQSESFHTQETILLDEERPRDLEHSYSTVPTLPVLCDGPRTPPRQVSDEDEELATIPFSVKETPIARPYSQLQSSYITQPTQLIPQAALPRSSSPIDRPHSNDPVPPSEEPTVQVAASSPAHAVPQPRRPGGILANSMAPAGTAFRPPVHNRPSNPVPPKVAQKSKPVIDISSDDEVRFAGGSSGDERYNRDLKPTLVKSGSVGSSGARSAQSSFGPGLDKFRHNGEAGTTSSPYSKESILARASDPMASAYGGGSRPARPPPPLKKQTGPAKAVPVYDMALLDIQDFQLRSAVQRMKEIAPASSVRQRYDALIAKKGNYDDACEHLFTEMENSKKRSRESEDELSSQAGPRKQTTKLQIGNNKSIMERQQERRAALAARKPSQTSKPSQPAVDLIQGEEEEAPAQAKPRRRLIRRGERPKTASIPSSPVAAPAPKAPARSATPISLDSDDSENEPEPEADPLVEGSLLKYFNECTVEDLVDMASTKKNDAELLLSKRPFRSLAQVRNVVREGVAKPGAKRKPKDQPIGERIVETSQEMWTGYNAVDELVRECENIGKPLIEEMGKWGVNVFGNASDGELELVNFDRGESESSAKDSGIGTPSSISFSDEEGGVKGMAKRKTRGKFFEQPVSLAEGVVLKDYQVVGINWLSLLYRHGNSCILADDMGLGKTCQVISFIAHLRETGVQGTHLIVVPSSVLENWLREFERFCPDIVVTPYHGLKDERPVLQEEILQNRPDVVVTTYTIAKKLEDRKFFTKYLKPTCCIYDEGHMLKNPNSEQYKELMKINGKFRLLLTGTPLQNNLSELIALLGFLMPHLFRDHSEALQAIFKQKATTDDTQHQALLSAQRIARAKSMMTPFILRRKKHQVLKDIPAKHRRVDYCEMTDSQKKKYDEIKENYRDMMRRRAAGQKSTAKETSNILMSLRKAAIHPLLFRRHYTDALLRKISKACKSEPEFAASNEQYIYEDLEYASDMELHRWCSKYPSVQRFALKKDEWMDSGKVQALVSLLKTYRANGDRVLIFSQFVMVLDILEEVLETEHTKFARLDGDVDINVRQELIDGFYNDESIMVFMLSTKAGGAGVNLACANKVIIFDGSFNPQDDVQAENRAHRVGQTREVEVVRLVTKDTVEEQIHALGQTKLALDERVAGEAADEGEGAKKADKAGEKKVEKMLEEALGAKVDGDSQKD